ncbi:hypothetical protein Bca4012_062441 [Brassica carinata]|uniref:Uncharacterized protein n=1 Tax=Brassica carinata TaxID=52824 RepID=A0A8X7SGN5_BRACI|nr:hypothetical protein Bca52824_032335 [Brassica carinata]
MAYDHFFTVLIVLVSISLTSSYYHPTRDVLFEQDNDESYSMATSEQGSSMIDVEDLVKARSLQALLAGSKVAVNKASKSTSSKTQNQKGSKSWTSLRLHVEIMMVVSERWVRTNWLLIFRIVTEVFFGVSCAWWAEGDCKFGSEWLTCVLGKFCNNGTIFTVGISS